MVRSLAGVGNLTWDEGLASSAQDWAGQCAWFHGSGSYGENLGEALGQC